MAIKTLFGPKPKELSSDAQAVQDASKLLRVSDIQFFKQAFASWYGREADETELEQHFGQYLYSENSPAWVRHYCRLVQDKYEAGELDILPGSAPESQEVADELDEKMQKIGLALGFVLTSLLVLISIAV